MSTQDPRRAPAQPALTPLPQVEDLPISPEGYDRGKVEEAFEAFRRHATALQAQLRVFQAAPRGATAEPTGHAVRMDALHLVRAAAEFADTIERDAQEAAAKQIARAEKEIRERHMNLNQHEVDIQRIRQETERQRVEIVNAARAEAREIVAKAKRDSASELRQAKASGSRLLEQARHQATELANAARAEVEQTLEWARAQADVVAQRARDGAEQLLSAAGHGDAAVSQAVDAIVRAADDSVEGTRRPPQPDAPAPPIAAAPAEAGEAGDGPAAGGDSARADEPAEQPAASGEAADAAPAPARAGAGTAKPKGGERSQRS